MAAEQDKRARGRRLLVGALLCAFVVMLAVTAGVYRWLWVLPPPPTVQLAELPIPAPGDLLDWSPDGARLLVANRRGEMWVVDRSVGRIKRLPTFKPTTWGAMWGPEGSPIVFARENRAITQIFALADGLWKPLPIRAVDPVPSPDRSRVAYLSGRALVREYWQHPQRPLESRNFRAGRFVQIADLRTGRPRRDIALPAIQYPQVHWANDEVLIIRGRMAEQLQVFQCRVASGKLEPATEPYWPPKAPPVSLEYVSTRIRDQELRNRLAKLGIPGLPQSDDRDWWLVVRDSHGAEVTRYALGRRAANRRSTAGAFHTWKCARPDGSMQRWALLSAYERLHVLELPSKLKS